MLVRLKLTKKTMSGDDNKCEICDVNSFIYKCPACHCKTCSLNCVKEHKSQSNCSGVRNRSALVRKRDMDNFTLLSDYRFLEEIDHKLEDDLRNPIGQKAKRREDFNDLPKHLKRLKIEAKNRGTTLDYMPRTLTKHTENSTRFNFKEKLIRWHIKWVFPHADVSYMDEGVSEDQLVVDALMKFLEPRGRIDSDEEQNPIDDHLLKQLEYYQSASYNKICVLLKCEMCRYDPPYMELSLSQSFKENFVGKKIVEYPMLFVVFKDHLDAFIDPNTREERSREGFKALGTSNATQNDSQLGFFGQMSDDSD